MQRRSQNLCDFDFLLSLGRPNNVVILQNRALVAFANLKYPSVERVALFSMMWVDRFENWIGAERATKLSSIANILVISFIVVRSIAYLNDLHQWPLCLNWRDVVLTKVVVIGHYWTCRLITWPIVVVWPLERCFLFHSCCVWLHLNLKGKKHPSQISKSLLTHWGSSLFRQCPTKRWYA